MTSFPKLIAAAVVVLASTYGLADTIQLGSYATGAASMGNANTALNYAGFNATSTTPSTGTATSFTLTPGSSWGAPVANSTWVGEASNAGPVGTVNPAMGYYTFTTTFTALSSGAYSGILNLMADDTAEVLLNGTVLVPFGTLGSDTHCAAGMPSCTISDNVTLSGLNLHSGVNANTLTFVVQQAGNVGLAGSDPSGVDFDAVLTSGAVPEPGSLALMATGLAVLGGAFLMRRMGFAKA